jgi:hypothetical protein
MRGVGTIAVHRDDAAGTQDAKTGRHRHSM